jgi:alpha-ketoglutarate-dependent taurine dioxygenase
MEQTYRTPFWARALDDLPGLIMPSAARRTADVELSLTYTGKESSEIIALALQRGWCLFKVEKETATSSLSTKLGQIVPSRLSGPSIDRLTPTDTASANPASQSRFFGLGEFPFHTDAAYKERPPRFVLLRCETAGSSGRQTFLLRPDLRPNPAWQRELINALVCVDNGTTRFYSSVLTRTRRRLLPTIRSCLHETRQQDSEEALRKSPPAALGHGNGVCCNVGR